MTRRLRVALLSALVALPALATTAAPVMADSFGEVEMGISVRPTETAYGEVLTLEATTRDESDSCNFTPLPSCNFPHGRIDFYAVAGGVQTFLTSGELTLDSDVPIGFWQTSTDDIAFCCLAIGSYDFIRAYYVPGDFDPESIDSGPVSVSKNGSTTTLEATPTTISAGQTVTFNVHTAGYSSHPNAATATGFVDVFEGPTNYGTAALDANGNATITTSLLPPGVHEMRARWGGDDHYTASFSAPVIVTVGGGRATVSLQASATSTSYGQPVTFTSRVEAVAPAVGPPTGTVSFRESDAAGTVIGTATLDEASPNQAVLTTSALGVGSHVISAVYGGDPVFQAATSDSVAVTVSKASTTTTLSSSANPSTFGQEVTFTATVDGPGVTTVPGTVQFKDGTMNLGAPQPLVLGQAFLTLGGLAGGSHSITAVYGGSANYLGSTSAALVQSVQCDQTITGTVGSITTSGGSTCLSGAKVTGNISVPDGSSLSIVNSTVSGSVTITGSSGTARSLTAGAAAGGAITICGSTISGNVRVERVDGFVLIGDPLEDACAGNTIKGSVTIIGTTGGLAVADNRIGGGVTVAYNTGGPSGHEAPEVEANRIGGFLNAYGNTPIASDDGRPNTVRGWVVFG